MDTAILRDISRKCAEIRRVIQNQDLDAEDLRIILLELLNGTEDMVRKILTAVG